MVMRNLTVLFDASCDICTAARAWMLSEPHYVPLMFIPAGSDEARQRFPDLDHGDTLREITAIDDTGAVYRGAKAWVMCLWALPRYRAWASRLGGPRPLPGAREFIGWVSRNRHNLSAFGRVWKGVSGLSA
jgi:predicted DCC family thiol-disulfide oxidoreductase YuxK